MNEQWVIPASGGESKCQWSPYAGYAVIGQIHTVVIRGEEVFVDGRFINRPGFGKNVRLASNINVEKEFKNETKGIMYF